MPSAPHPTDEFVSAIADWFRAAGDETRVRILMRLKSGECSVGEIAAHLGAGQATVSKHLGILRRARIVGVRREGTSAYYSLRGEVPLQICALLCRDIAEEQRRVADALSQDLNASKRSPSWKPRK